MTLLLASGQIIFSLLNLFCVIFDIILLISVVKHKFFTKSSNKSPFVYISVMTIPGIIGKFVNFFVVDAWPVANWIDPIDGYETYRKLIGKEITLIATFCYLTEIFINWLMTFHRVSILLSPGRAPDFFTDTKLFMYCSGIMGAIMTTLLIPYYSSCYVNFNAMTSLHETACAPKKHPLTTYQNLYLIWVPVSAVIMNSTMIFYIKFSRKFIKKPLVLSSATIKRENNMIRQACFIASYLSFFEFGYTFIRLYPQQFGSLSQDVQAITYLVRLFAICSLNFFVYFVETKSTRNLILNFIGWRKKITLVTPTIISVTQSKKL